MPPPRANPSFRRRRPSPRPFAAAIARRSVRLTVVLRRFAFELMVATRVSRSAGETWAGAALCERRMLRGRYVLDVAVAVQHVPLRRIEQRVGIRVEILAQH